MQKKIAIKLLIIAAVLVGFTALIFLGNEWDKSIPAIKEQGLMSGLKQSIRLGLDLKGGMHMILQVRVNEAISADTDRVVEVLKEQLQKNKVAFTDIAKPDPANHPETISVKGLTAEGGFQLRTIVQNSLTDYDATTGAEVGVWNVVMKLSRQVGVKQETLSKSIDAIRTRVDTLGVSEPVVQENGLGNYQILVQLPGVDDPDRVKEILKSTARLEFREWKTSYASEAEALKSNPSGYPPNTVLLPGRTVADDQGGDKFYLVSRTSVASGTDIRDADAGRKADNNAPIVNFNLTVAAGKKFGEFTDLHRKGGAEPSGLAIVLDNHVISAAGIESQIFDRGFIEGTFSEQYTKDLAMLVRSGALPASLDYLSENNVGPSLGADSIRSGVKSAIGGLLAVMIFMLVYYRGAGINANLALIFNLILLLGCMGLIGGVLTLPGIAGVILTIGMGVDSNVLIFERIREELRQGKTPAAAVDQGFSKAWTTILDTHVTTVVSALILFLVGKGPVSGFGLTLIIGLIANLFTAVFVSRVIFDFVLSRKQRGAALSI